MKIAQFYYKNRVCLGVIEANGIAVIDFDGDMVDFIKRGEPPEISSKTISLEEVKWAAPVSRPSKIIGLGLNHAYPVNTESSDPAGFVCVFAPS
jgi:hypothetical protein